MLFHTHVAYTVFNTIKSTQPIFPAKYQFTDCVTPSLNQALEDWGNYKTDSIKHFQNYFSDETPINNSKLGKLFFITICDLGSKYLYKWIVWGNNTKVWFLFQEKKTNKNKTDKKRSSTHLVKEHVCFKLLSLLISPSTSNWRLLPADEPRDQRSDLRYGHLGWGQRGLHPAVTSSPAEVQPTSKHGLRCLELQL